MSWFSWLTGNNSTAEKVVDGVVNGVDAMFYTNEEKAVAMQKVLDLKIDFAKHTAFMSISRRVITVIVAALWAANVLLLIAIGVAFGKEAAAFKLLFDVLRDIVNPPFMIIVGFYFMAQVASKIKGKP